MRLACRLRELREARGLRLREFAAELATSLPEDVKICAGDLSRLERGRMLAPDGWVPWLEAAYGAPSGTWYVPPAGMVAGVAIERDGEVA